MKRRHKHEANDKTIRFCLLLMVKWRRRLPLFVYVAFQLKKEREKMPINVQGVNFASVGKVLRFSVLSFKKLIKS